MNHRNLYFLFYFIDLSFIFSKVSMREFQQILYIFPNEYDLKWEKNEGYKNESDLLINFPAEFLNDKTVI